MTINDYKALAITVDIRSRGLVKTLDLAEVATSSELFSLVIGSNLQDSPVRCSDDWLRLLTIALKK